MKKNFSQSFDHLKHTTVYFLIEVKKGVFLHFDYRDELGLDYYNGLSLEADTSEDYTTQITKYLYENGFSLNRYRELIRETTITFSFIDETPGLASDRVCVHVYADEIISNSNDARLKKKSFLTLDEMIDRFVSSPDLPNVVALGIAKLINERAITDSF